MPIIQVRVKPNARESRLLPQADGTFIAQVKAAPVEGKANGELIRLVAEHFGCTRARVTIKTGGASRTKRIVVEP
jgi:uncharacterized protein